MSSTNRGYERHVSDYYVTPIEDIVNFLTHWQEDVNGPYHDTTIDLHLSKWLDPCAGGDFKHDISYPLAIKQIYDVSVDTLDIRPDSRAAIITDYLNYDVRYEQYGVIITNPPFLLARQIIEKALRDVKADGYVVMLLRLNYFGSAQRFDLWETQLPVWCYVHHKRISFTDDNKTDSIEYCHMVWQKNQCPEFTMLKVI